MKKSKLFLIFILLLIPTFVNASPSLDQNGFTHLFALGMELFVTIHMSIFVFMPLSKIFSKDEKTSKLFWKMFIIRWIILLIFDFFITPLIAIFDFLSVFVGAFIVVPISLKLNNKSRASVFGISKTQGKNNSKNNVKTINPSIQGIVLKCAKCGSVLTLNHKFCNNCGEAFAGDNVKVEYDSTKSVTDNMTQQFVKPGSFDSMFALTEDKMLEEFINREITKAGIDKTSKLIPSDILKRKKIFNIIFSVLIFTYISLIFFHFPLLTYIIGIFILFIFFKLTRKYNLMSYLKKELQSRPSEKVSNIVMNVKTTFTEDTSKKVLFPCLLIAIILPLIIFIKPIVLYEKMDGGYAVRYYIFGVNNFTSATIPETYKNEKIISLRGNTFSNMPFLEKVTLPDSIIEIRGQAFKNNKSLKSAKLPNSLNYLGGGAFYNCTSLEYIEIPDSVTYIGGEAFYNAKSLKSIKLSNNLLEIRGSTFENCTSLQSIKIPDSVTRIGGHAFYGNSSLNLVDISENSKLIEIGSSAFRRCNSLYEIILPKGVSVNYRAFKESPTNVKEYGVFDISQNTNSRYLYDTFIFMKLGDTRKINEYITSAILQDAYITLVSINQINNLYEFNFKYSDLIGEGTFTLTQQYPYTTISENLVIEIKDDYVFETYSDEVSFYAYYN